jgi:hypothetical protein
MKQAKKWAMKSIPKHTADKLAPGIPDNIYIPHK